MARIAVFYQYFHPDPNVSSLHLSELSAGLVQHGCQVTAYPSNRNIANPRAQYPASDTWQGVQIKRLWRPGSSRASSLGRMLNAAWMIARWSLLALRPDPPAVIIVGTDPILSVLVVRIWKIIRPKTLIAHWCFDLYPEAAYADGILNANGRLARIFAALLRPSYAACDLVVDIGPCMRSLLLKYGHRWQTSTLVPWALSEPDAPLPTPPVERRDLFGPSALALMYSGTFGRAHSFEDMLELMRLLSDAPVHLAFSVQGQREAALRAAASSLQNVSFVPFASKEGLNDRLASADIHIVSLREEWTGMVIPSKFFGALAVGRPILFCGSRNSSLAIWIRQYGLGWVLEPGNAAQVAAELRAILVDPAALEAMRERCFRVYHEHFSRSTIVAQWNTDLTALLTDVPL